MIKIKTVNRILVFIQLALLVLEICVCYIHEMPFGFDIGVLFESPIFYDMQCIIRMFDVFMITLCANVIYFFACRKNENYVKVSKYVLTNFVIFLLGWPVSIFSVYF